MSLFDYLVSKDLMKSDPSFAALIMAAYRRADTFNAALLQQSWPDICAELQTRYNAPGGRLPGEE